VSAAVWTATWPTERGDYLFFGGSLREDWVHARPEPEFIVVKVRISGNGHPMWIGGGRFLYPQEMVGVFRQFNEPYPVEVIP
jgi:ribosomal protein L31